jgi:aerobic-type carbon monoxide dehydrogenase small subunit (CoxS/CutS family)
MTSTDTAADGVASVPAAGERACTVQTTVNGVRVERALDPRMTLVEFLREDLELTGTKVSCGLQVCGVCTVLVDDQPVSSCTYLAADVDGRAVRTVEGLAREGALNGLQRSFAEEFALQCGFCTPGFLMMATALLERDPDPTEETIREYLDGNFCRCTGYQPIVAAVRRAAARKAGEAGGEPS